MGWNEWPLMFFTVIAQSAMGAFWWCSFALLAVGLTADQRSRLERSMLAIWIMMGIAFVFSSAHLGSPLRAINAIFRFGHSPLSNEVVFGSIFFGLGFLRWLLIVRNAGSETLKKSLLLLTLVTSFAFLWGMSTFYLIPTVPTWNTPLTPVAFILTALIAGGVVAATIFAISSVDNAGILRIGPVRLAGLALLAAIIVTLSQSASLSSINSSVKHAAELSPHYVSLMSVRFLLLFFAIGLWFRQTMQGRNLTVSIGLFCVVLVMIGELIGRGVFYKIYMTVGLI